MNCLEVRDRLVERSLGALHLEDATEVDRHLLWCAACRKEAAELDRAAATLRAHAGAGLARPPASRTASWRPCTPPPTPRRGRPGRRGLAATASVIAAAVAVSALGWGVAMAGRAERFRASATQEPIGQGVLLRRVDALVGDQVFRPPATGPSSAPSRRPPAASVGARP